MWPARGVRAFGSTWDVRQRLRRDRRGRTISSATTPATPRTMNARLSIDGDVANEAGVSVGGVVTVGVLLGCAVGFAVGFGVAVGCAASSKSQESVVSPSVTDTSSA